MDKRAHLSAQLKIKKIKGKRKKDKEKKKIELGVVFLAGHRASSSGYSCRPSGSPRRRVGEVEVWAPASSSSTPAGPAASSGEGESGGSGQAGCGCGRGRERPDMVAPVRPNMGELP
jgi:hypothetical protein